MLRHPVRWVLAAGAVALFSVLALYYSNTTVPFGERSPSFSELGGSFELESYHGNVRLDDHLGQVVVMYFGYLTCTEVCPISMAVMSAAFQRLDEAHYNDVQGFFISVDPERDDLSALYEYSQYFDERILGVTGTSDVIEAVTRQYGVYYDLVDLTTSTLTYTVDHVSRFYIVSPTGELLDSMNHTTTPIELAARIERARNGV